jgi:hypothetical protein
MKMPSKKKTGTGFKIFTWHRRWDFDINPSFKLENEEAIKKKKQALASRFLLGVSCGTTT